MFDSTQTIWDQHDRLASDLSCVGCGHNLRGLARFGRCGECGTPVELSLAGNYMFDRDPAWIRSLRVGVQCLCLTLIWLWCPPAWLIVGYGFWSVTTPDPDSSTTGRRSEVVLRILLAVFIPLLWFGALPVIFVYWMEYGFSVGVDPRQVAFIFACCVWLITPLLYAAVLRRVVALANVKRLRRSLSSAIWFGALAVPLAACGAVDAAANLGLDVLVGLAVIGGLLWLASWCRLIPTMLRLWRLLDISETQAIARRSQLRYWRTSIPGGASPSPSQ